MWTWEVGKVAHRGHEYSEVWRINSMFFRVREKHEPFWVVHWFPWLVCHSEASDLIGAISDDAMFMGLTELPTKHQPENTVDKFSLDMCEDLHGQDLVVCLHVEIGRCIIDLGKL